MLIQKLHLFSIGILAIIIIPPFSTPLHGSPSFTTSETPPISPQLNTHDSSKVNSLFSFDPTEKTHLTQLLNKYDPDYLHFFDNFPMGYVTFSQHTLSLLPPDLYSRLHISKKREVLPSIDQLRPQLVTRGETASALPASIIRAEDLWEKGIDGSGVKIAVIDSGIDGTPSHAAFTDRIKMEKSFVKTKFGYDTEEDARDYHGHGTHVAGIAAGGEIMKYPGIAYGADLYNLKAAGMSGYSTQESLIAAIDEAINLNVDIISISLGFSTSYPWSSEDELSIAVDTAVDAGIIVVVAAGNEGSEGEFSSISSPASARKAITVGATNESYDVASFSSRGPSFGYKVDPDVVAPGVQIVAPLASGCVIERAYEAIVNVELEDYIIFSGTSMAAPVVAGAVALLKQQFPLASPSAIRAALQESAINMGESVYLQGSGLVDVSAAFTLLQTTQKDDSFEIITSLPKASGNIEFADTLTFPGDRAQINIPLITGMGGTIIFEISDPIKAFVTTDKEADIHLSQAGYYEKSLNFSIPFNIAHGTYRGNFSYKFSGTSYSIPIIITVKHPQAKIYWDTHYTGKDDSPFFNYRSLDNYSTSILHFDLNEYETALTWENLSQNDILVLTDLEFPISSREFQFLSDFHDHNGSILLVTSGFPYYNPYPYIKLSEVLDIPIDFSNRIDLINYTDDGRSRSIIPLVNKTSEIRWDSENPLFKGVDKLPLDTGTGIKVNQSSPHIKYLVQDKSSYSVLAAYEPPNKGKILFLGSDLWLHHSYLSTVDGQAFINNIFTWLKPEYNLTINSRISQFPRKLDLSVYYSSQFSLLLSITFSNGTSIETFLHYNTTLEHHYLELPLGTQPSQDIDIGIKDSNSLLKTFSLLSLPSNAYPNVSEIQVDFLATSNVSIPSWADESSDSVIDQGIDFSIIHSPSSLIYSVLMISSQLEETLTVLVPPIDSMSEIVSETNFLVDSLTQQSISWEVPTSFSTGYYSYEIYVWFEISDNVFLLLETDQGFFFISDPEPTLDVQSKIRGKTLDVYRGIETSEDVPTWNPGETVELRLIGKDTNSDEFEVYVQLIHYYLWFADSIVLDFFDIPSSTSNKSENIGAFSVPTHPIPLPEDEEYYVEITDELFVLLIFVRDKQGNYNIEVIYFFIGFSSYFDPVILVFSAVLGMVVISGVAIFLSRRRRSKTSYYSESFNYRLAALERPSFEWKQCQNCGTRIVREALFCSSCGTPLPSEKQDEKFT
ncbi:MAG: S8 family serine peptidase [Candidatus Heimdallarchaeota archaeon]|nr:MAG: S8 family serine peptidase [Candidatus Heimdallarchaeota archaeon]